MTTETTAAAVQRLRRRRFAAVPDPTLNIHALYNTVLALKENLELLVGERADPHASDTMAVTWAELLELGLITEDQIPRSRVRS